MKCLKKFCHLYYNGRCIAEKGKCIIKGSLIDEFENLQIDFRELDWESFDMEGYKEAQAGGNAEIKFSEDFT